MCLLASARNLPKYAMVALLGGGFLVFALQAQTDAAASPQSTQMDAYEAALKANPQDADARKGEVQTGIAEALKARRNRQNELALAYLLRARYWVPDDPELLLDLGIQEESMKLYHDADAAVTEAGRLRPDDLKTLYATARIKMDVNQMQASEEAWKRYLALRPDDATAHYGYGLLLQMLQRTDEAKEQFVKSIELQPKQAESYYRLGEIAREAGNIEEARKEYQEALAFDPTHAGAWTGLGVLAFRAKQYAEAEEDLEKAVQYAPDFQTAHYYRGLTLAKLGRKEESEKELAVAVQLADEQNSRKDQSRRLAPQPYQPQ
ncbi:tetratricopeptide repeat protein [Pseudacidobacterium ailaaui]|jgi:tetratricopeptide (TPR) repeat protein|uniref:tetratricopeptide repeat protein n=1 Tax=Pseudacidobacterium ailaaui TaxID=1382359 RepID=UPI00047C0C36|nr:tetratricopeptide repeat protein [Pseudacidobacterium ailaaui]MBX6360645.1 tetratricopeptide repeat protein [Pseudacidobacterium ailaaui]